MMSFIIIERTKKYLKFLNNFFKNYHDRNQRRNRERKEKGKYNLKIHVYFTQKVITKWK